MSTRTEPIFRCVFLLGLVALLLACGDDKGSPQDDVATDVADTASDTTSDTPGDQADAPDTAVDIAMVGPVAVDDAASGDENNPVTVDVLANDSDRGGLGLELASVGEPAFGRADIVSGQVVYAPDMDWDGVDTFDYTVANTDGLMATATVTVTIAGLDHTPVAAPDAGSMALGGTLTMNVLDNDVDPERLPLDAVLLTPPGQGQLTLQPDGSADYTPPDGFNGSVFFEYTARDPAGNQATAVAWITVYDSHAAGAPVVQLPKVALGPADLGLIINDADPDSVSIGAAYQLARGIPAENVFHVTFPLGGAVMQPADFDAVLAQLDPVGDHIQAWALTWLTPYRVGCMSMTSAFAFGGYGDQWCNTSGGACSATAPAVTFRSDTVAPFTDLQIRPTMMLAGTSVSDVQALINRGVAADDTFPAGDGYFVRTTDTARSVRFPNMVSTLDDWDHPGGLALSYVDNSDGSGSNVVANTGDVLFYFTGLANVPEIATNTYLPGAAADHLTSYGGRLDGSGQMSIVRWLEAGATGSYGTAVEPCNYTQKFPEVGTMLQFYYRGATLLEAYWKSVAWPGEGVFVGEPLARPWGKTALLFDGTDLIIRTTWLRPGRPYRVESAAAANSAWSTVESGIMVSDYGLHDVVVNAPDRLFYRLVPDL